MRHDIKVFWICLCSFLETLLTFWNSVSPLLTWRQWKKHSHSVDMHKNDSIYLRYLDNKWSVNENYVELIIEKNIKCNFAMIKDIIRICHEQGGKKKNFDLFSNDFVMNIYIFSLDFTQHLELWLVRFVLILKIQFLNDHSEKKSFGKRIVMVQERKIEKNINFFNTSLFIGQNFLSGKIKWNKNDPFD